MVLGSEAVLDQERFVGLRLVGGIGPDGWGRVALVEQAVAQSGTFELRRICDVPLADEAVRAIDRDVVLVAEARDRDVDLILAVRRRLGLGELDCP